MQLPPGENHPVSDAKQEIYNGVIIDVPGITGDSSRPRLLMQVYCFCRDLVSGEDNVRFKTYIEDADTRELITENGVG